MQEGAGEAAQAGQAQEAAQVAQVVAEGALRATRVVKVEMVRKVAPARSLQMVVQAGKVREVAAEEAHLILPCSAD